MKFDHRSGRAISVRGAQIYVEQVGAQSNPPLVLLHGGVGDIEDFNSLATELSAHYRLIAIDSRGHGASSSGGVELTYMQLADDALAIIDALAVPAMSVIGFSDGGIVGYRLALKAASRVRRLVAISASCRLTEPTAGIFEGVTASYFDEEFPETRRQYARLNPQGDFEGLVRASVRMWTDRSEHGYPGDRVSDISCPTLLVRGDDDPLFSLEEAAELRQLIRNSHLLNVPFAGHTVLAENPRLIVESIVRFLSAE